MEIRWNENHIMGVEELDREHRQLFAIAGKLVDRVEEQDASDSAGRLFVLREGLKYLRSYFASHAVREEAYMRQIGYPGYAAHKRLHDEFQNVNLRKYEAILEKGACSREEVLDFVGLGIGWLVEHISTADLAIVGKGVLSKPRQKALHGPELEREINQLFAATLNLSVEARIIERNYSGGALNEAVYHELIYQKGEQQVSVLAGIEKDFLLRAAEQVYGSHLEELDALILSTLELFSANFWRTLGNRFAGGVEGLEYRENHYLLHSQIKERFERRIPKLSLLFSSNSGRFFVASDLDLEEQP